MGSKVKSAISRIGLMADIRPMAIILIATITLGTGWVGTITALAQTETLSAEINAAAKDVAQLQSRIKISDQRKRQLAAEISKLKKDQSVLSTALVETAKRSRSLEDEITRLEQNLATLARQEADIRLALKQRRGILAKVLASLQRMGKNPPPALLIRPRDALASVRTAILLGAVVPELRSETTLVLSQLEELLSIRTTTASKHQQIKTALASLEEDEIRLSLLLDQKTRLSGERGLEYAKQQKEIAQLASRATSLKSLITELKRKNEVARASRLAEEKHQLQSEKRLALARQKGISKSRRIGPRTPFIQTKGQLLRPVSGVEVQSWGEKTNLGSIASGIAIATRNKARVVAPSDAEVVYAGPFRSYGKLVILDAGEKYHIVLAGMDRINVSVGQFVLAGEPIGQMGARRVASSSITVVGSSRPLLYVEFRNNDKSFDPTPWWAPTSLKRLSNDS